MKTTSRRLALLGGTAALLSAGGGVAVAASTHPDHPRAHPVPVAVQVRSHSAPRHHLVASHAAISHDGLSAGPTPATPALLQAAYEQARARWGHERDLDADGRPRDHLFLSAAQEQALNQPYQDCQLIAAHDGSADATSSCGRYDPLPAWQYDRTNPQSMPFVSRVVACLTADGVSAEAVAAPPDSDQNEITFSGDSTTAESGLAYIRSCEQAALRG